MEQSQGGADQSYVERVMVQDRVRSRAELYHPFAHAPDCDFHADQYPAECDCGTLRAMWRSSAGNPEGPCFVQRESD